MRFYDAHNHLQDRRFGGHQAALVAEAAGEGVVRMVVNGSGEADWPDVLALARAHPAVLPSFGCHPWYLGECTPDWQATLLGFLDQSPSAVGEIGLDRWKPGLAYAGQEDAFVWQLRAAAERDRPASIHCLQAWGRLLDLLRAQPRPACGFLLHSFGGPAELVAPLTRLGAYFGFPGYFLHERKHRQRDTFRVVPPDRLLLETDAPDQPLPDLASAAPAVREALAASRLYSVAGGSPTKPLNHPANLAAVYRGAAQFLGRSIESFATQIEENFLRLFGG